MRARGFTMIEMLVALATVGVLVLIAWPSIAATNRDLREEVARKAFREDLYYRLAVIRVHLPPLRERGRDIDLLIEHFMRQFASERHLQIQPDDVMRLRNYTWPGNVRELRNVVERLSLLRADEGAFVIDADAAQALGAVEEEVRVRRNAKWRLVQPEMLEVERHGYFSSVELMRL